MISYLIHNLAYLQYQRLVLYWCNYSTKIVTKHNIWCISLLKPKDQNWCWWLVCVQKHIYISIVVLNDYGVVVAACVLGFGLKLTAVVVHNLFPCIGSYNVCPNTNPTSFLCLSSSSSSTHKYIQTGNQTTDKPLMLSCFVLQGDFGTFHHKWKCTYTLTRLNLH